MIEVKGLRKFVVDGIDFVARPGRVTGLLGPNGAGKSTTLRVLLGLARPVGGVALVHGRRYAELRHPLRTVGALLDAAGPLPEQRAVDHLRWLALSNAVPRRRVAQVLELAGLTAVARRRAGRLSLGMRQRLGIAAALLGDPSVLVLDEPTNGLDPDGIRWVRDLARESAAAGRTVLLSSHVMADVAATVDDLVIIRRGRIVADGPLAAVTAGHPSLEAAFFALTGDER
ncbi:ATP-binding cassette domain-containing protein [Dactylosporangium vinaceum]|uniref:ABC transporter ATP-binding protein n=1 Tax=Dactylosporangium vinaceum TaxID=53362 RepID=A0ABV5MCN7_9ACTN|nr:ATP-binding cassette domain-containing protein [Dactylosporangium vinaceum]UAC00690.1 ATP-binding cassette domain-containing protein [Dactylosporangium vinaceum]